MHVKYNVLFLSQNVCSFVVDYVVAIDFAESVSASSGKSMCAVREGGKTLREREKTLESQNSED
jgi:hypothetical protein